MTTDFRELAKEIARRNNIETLLPVVEKELLHYGIIHALDESKWLSALTFQGGTCLRLCYGAVRYSEDLDFTITKDLSSTDLEGFREILTKQLTKDYGLDAVVKEPKRIQTFEGGALMKRWQVVVDTTPSRADLPSQKIKIEIVQVPSYTRELKILNVNYSELAGVYSNIVIAAESTDEILADKLVSFSLQENMVRYRDLWDMSWIKSHSKIDLDNIIDMVAKKYADYGAKKTYKDSALCGLKRSVKEIQSERFKAEMLRFLPSETIENTLIRDDYLKAISNTITDLYERVAAAF